MDARTTKITQCIIDKDLFGSDRECVVKDPTAEPLEVIAVVTRNTHLVFDTTPIHLKRFFCMYDIDVLQDEGIGDFDGYPHPVENDLRYQWELNGRVQHDDCPPLELPLLLQVLCHNKDPDFHGEDKLCAFLWYCERRANAFKDAAYTAHAAADAADAAAHAAADTARVAARIAACIADAAAHAADAAYAAAYATHAAETCLQIAFLKAMGVTF